VGDHRDWGFGGGGLELLTVKNQDTKFLHIDLVTKMQDKFIIVKVKIKSLCFN